MPWKQKLNRLCRRREIYLGTATDTAVEGTVCDLNVNKGFSTHSLLKWLTSNTHQTTHRRQMFKTGHIFKLRSAEELLNKPVMYTVRIKDWDNKKKCFKLRWLAFIYFKYHTVREEVANKCLQNVWWKDPQLSDLNTSHKYNLSAI